MFRGCRVLHSNGAGATIGRSTRLNRGFKATAICGLAQEVSDGTYAPLQERLAQIDTERPFSPFLVDTFQRRHNYLRISLTERCNLRCFYCMPSEGVELSPRDHILTDDEVIRLAKLFVRSGVTKIRLTGGEPTVRKGLGDIVARLNGLRQLGLESVGMTSNGIALERRLPLLVENGLTHLNLSLDTLDPFKFEIMTRRRGHEAVLRCLDAALASGLQSVKLNIVVVQGLNDHEVLDFLELTRNKELSVRFIEFMPFTGNKWDKCKMVPSTQLLTRIRQRHPNIAKAPDELNDTARSYIIPGYQGSFGFISSMSDHFCSSCNRLRLTADGQIKVCLFDAKEISLRDRMRAGATDEELLQTIGFAVQGKKAKHAGMEDIDVVTNRPMILIGASVNVAVTPSRRGASRSPMRRPTLFHARPVLLRPPSLAAHSFSTKGPSASDAGNPNSRLTHLDDSGRASMVDISNKEPTKRRAVATGRIYIPAIAYELVTTTYAAADPGEPIPAEQLTPLEKAKAKARSKGDVLTVAKLAAIMACKRTSDLIPLCHPLQLTHIAVTLQPEVHRSASGSSASEAPQYPAAVSDSDVGTTCQERGVDRTRFSIQCRADVTCEGKTGVEMEALTAVSIGLLTVWDMLKAVAGQEMTIGDVVVSRKEGGKSGDFQRVQSR
ncbi:molybdenum cofactor biosynthesis prote [Rhodofomes roseus]|uniref:GTP 3',8-cyclase n=1 Tax=Rhodofomes roseus TaxID=34475 RepID=A0ABQ8KHE0_9APHY|nr:molybdenum cofactor biosynthesis prote [Rhodofomes roseus]KAH9837250.1 molybdenum cofactor biosynthesis prote [Rhodofomes roseus]